MRRFLSVSASVLLLVTGAVLAQEASPTMPKKNPPVTTSTRLAAARTVFVTDAGGSSIPYNVISSSMEGWGRYQLVNSPEKADLILEISSSSSGDGGGVSVSSTTDSGYGAPGSKTTTSKELSTGPIRLRVIDGKSKSVLWAATEQPKYAMRKKQQEDNIVDAAEKLFSKFHDRVEPPLPAQ